LAVFIPESEDFREPLLILEVLLVVVMVEISLIYLRKIMSGKQASSNNMLVAWTQFLICYTAVWVFFIVGDFYTLIEWRARVLNIGYTIAGLGALLFSYHTEHEIEMKRHYFSIIILALTCGIVLNAVFSFLSTSVYLTFIIWVIFIILVILYIKRFTELIPDRWKLNVYSLVIGIILVILGFGGTSDMMISATQGFGIRFVGDGLIILGMVFISILFIGVPSLAEFEWWTKIKYLAIMHQSGLSIAHFNFNQDKDAPSIDDLLMAGGLTSLSQVISTMVQSEKKLDSVDHGDLKLLFQYGKYLINVLVVSAPLVILRSKLKKVTETLEMLYKEEFAHWDGDLTRFTLLEQVVNVHFKPKMRSKEGGE
jgi:hypothetical protein